MEIYKQIEKDGIRITIEYDEYCEDPRKKWDNLETMVCWHSRYKLGDDHDFSEPDNFREEIDPKENLILPLYLYDHSGISMNTVGFHCPWDSGQVGWIYVSYEKIKSEFGNLSEETIEKVRKYLVSEVETYDLYLRGEVFSFSIEKAEKCGDCGHVSYEPIDSCCGFYGSDFEANGMMEYISEEYLPIFKELIS